nr:deoxyguanosinetriphosphate triphosphohydrolase [Dermatophilus congolensis]
MGDAVGGYSSGSVDGGRYGARDRARWVQEPAARKLATRDDFARDRARILHSAGFRRLASKTQVVAPYLGDFARNRLTHSLEVAQIGREIASFLGCHADLVDAACLAHDLGHPPFGHNGERELNRVAEQVGGFEGNAQTLRVLTRLEPKRFHADGRPAGLNLTRAALDAACKYPWGAGQGPGGSGKFGFYADDEPVFAWVRDGAPSRGAGGVTPVEAQVMDWSDDVAYSVHDVEDAVASGRVDLRVLSSVSALRDVAVVAQRYYEPSLEVEALVEAGQRLHAADEVVDEFDGSRAGLAALKDMTSGLVGRFVRQVQSATRQVHGPVRLARYDGSLVVPVQARAECAMLKAVAAAFVMQTPGHAAVMEREREVVRGLVEAYLECPEERLDRDLVVDWGAASSDGERLRVVVDQVASLTDTRALALHARWCGSA